MDSEVSMPGNDGNRGRLRRNQAGRTNQTGRNPGRPVRAARPANLRDIETYGDNSASVDVVRQENRNLRRTNRRHLQSSENTDS